MFTGRVGIHSFAGSPCESGSQVPNLLNPEGALYCVKRKAARLVHDELTKIQKKALQQQVKSDLISFLPQAPDECKASLWVSVPALPCQLVHCSTHSHPV